MTNDKFSRSCGGKMYENFIRRISGETKRAEMRKTLLCQKRKEADQQKYESRIVSESRIKVQFPQFLKRF